MATFVLVAGAWLGAEAWHEVQMHLTGSGHDVVAVTLAGLGARAAEPAAEITLSTHIANVTDELESRDLHGVILVGHSYAGAVVTGAAMRAADRIARLVYVAGAVLHEGVSLFDLMGPEAAGGMEAMAAAAGDRDRLPVPGPGQLAMFYGDHGLVGGVYARFAAMAVPHPLGTFREPLPAGRFRVDDIPRTYVRCVADGPAPIAADAPGWTMHDLLTGHWPMLTRPGETASALLEAVDASA